MIYIIKSIFEFFKKINILMFFYCFNILILKLILKNKKILF
jgi:hypothetical protein